MGFINNVLPNAPILSTWGNAIRDRTVMQFASAAERSAQWASPPVGAVSYLTDTKQIETYVGGGTGWTAPYALGRVAFAEKTSDIGVDLTLKDAGLAVTFNAVSGRSYAMTGWTAGISGIQPGSLGWQMQLALNDNTVIGQAYGNAETQFLGAQCIVLVPRFQAVGSVTVKMRVQMVGGAGAAAVVSSTNPGQRAFILIEDGGPA